MFEVGGHSPGMAEPAPTHLKREILGLRYGSGSAAQIAKLEGLLAAYPPWAHKLPTLMLEGTGMIRKYVLPYAESYAGTQDGALWAAKGKAAWAFARAVKTKETPEFALLNEFARVQVCGSPRVA